MNSKDIQQSQIILLWSGSAPGSEDWTQQEQESIIPPDLKVVRNITQPTLTPYLPDPAAATGKAVIVCPGGAFHFLSIDMEGHDVARWLCERGVAAFVLKYRLIRTGDSFPSDVWEHMQDQKTMDSLVATLAPLVTADGQQAIRLVRQHAAEWNINNAQVGIMGFSAGGSVTVDVSLLHDAGSRPSFAAPIYCGPYIDAPVPADAPPLFLLCAHDDEMATTNSIRLYSSWKAAGLSAELHIYSKGGHGFGMRALGTPTDHWIERFYDWLQIL